MKKIFMILVISLIPISIHAQHVYIADFQNVDSYLGANRQMVSFSIPQTETWTEDFICAGSVYAENIDFIETSFNYYPGRSLRYVRFNLSYNGSGYPRLVIMLNSVKTVPLDFTATSNGHYDMAVENILSEQYWDGSHTVKLIFFVVDDLHKNTLVTKSSQILNSMDSPERIVSPINGTFSLSMEVTADEVSHMPDWDTIDPGPLYSDQNYIRSKTMTTQNGTSYIDEIEYYDGLGRPVQKIQKGISPKGHDWVTIRQYDGIGRKNREWLPAVIGSKEGEYVNPIVVMEAARITYDKDSHPYSFFEYDSSPLDRIVAQYGPGFNWYEQKRAQRMHYLANKCDVDSLNCIEFISIDAQTDTTLVITSIGNFQDGTLNVVGSSDEDGNMTLEFKNEQNQTLLIRQVAFFNGRQNLYDTYYIYDDMGNLRAVLPPEVSARLNETGSWSSDLSQDLRDYAYLYNYDSQNRCVAKKWPGSDWIRIIYDNSNDIPILTQDGEQRRHGEWGFSIPDVFGRIVLCGTCANNPDITSLSNTKVYAYKNFGNPGTILGYGVSGLELDSPKNITSYYYDDYLFLGVPEFLGKDLEYLSSGIDACFLTRYGAEEDSYSSNGLLTGSRTAVYSQTSDSLLARYAAYYYDSKKRPVQTREHYGIVARGEYRAYDFIGNVQRIIDEYSVDSQYTWTQETNFRYDHAGRLLEETTSLARDGATPTTAVRNYTYDELGRIISIGSGPEASAQSEQFSYNLRGWQIKRSSEAFRMSLYYNNPQHSTTVPSYSGNITEWSWTHNAENENTYAFSYDPLARLMSAKQYVGDIQEDRYVEREVTYDKNGNPLSLERLQSGEILHDFTYAYTGNQLATLSDGNVLYHYAYDSNGNMIHDGMNAFDLSYNQLNRVERVLCNNETLANYSYLADGTKFSATDADGNGFYYLGSLVYRK